MNDNEYEFVDSTLSPERNIFLENYLEPGIYVALVEFYNSNNLIRDYNVGTYSEESIDLQMIQIDSHSYEKIEHLIWKNYCQDH